jgi:hypothetical protein
MHGVPGPDGRHDDLDADQLEGLALLVPDDARSLDADRDAYLLELRRRRADQGGPGLARRSLLLRAFGAGRPGSGLAGPVLLVLLVVVGLVGSTLSVFSGSTADDQKQTPLAADPAGPVGAVGGLLPNTTVTIRGSHFDLRGARPAVLLLVPTPCPSCGSILRSVRGQIAEYNLGWILMGPADQQDQLRALNTTELGGSATVATDDTGLMRVAYTPSGVTAVMVRDNGLVAMVAKDLTASDRLEHALANLDGRSAPTA